MANRKIQMKSGSDNLYPEIAGYVPGDSISLTTSGLAQYPGIWISATELRWIMPLDRPVHSSVSQVTFSENYVTIHSNGSYVRVTLEDLASVSCEKLATGGIGVKFTFSEALSCAAARTFASVQTYRNTLTFA